MILSSIGFTVTIRSQLSSAHITSPSLIIEKAEERSLSRPDLSFSPIFNKIFFGHEPSNSKCFLRKGLEDFSSASYPLYFGLTLVCRPPDKTGTCRWKGSSRT